ncbi:subtilisin-like protein [Auricularia subglabra TFB-10046 SS5]|uniref:Subtilisin-like protein n=1 Tax=Auricularia subglabra (strain TFB-10046 / SS5) TaxID=717982 RepID=J0WV94_AURST|nr:subtilisin-like protein [Auricularia subglabra TFB-10046 SS5]
MRSSFAAATLLAATVLAIERFTPEQLQRLQEQQSTGNVVPGAYIVELSPPSAKRSIDSVHDEFLGELDKRAGGQFSTRKKYNSRIFNGISVQLKTPDDVADLALIPNVVSVSPIYKVSAPKPVSLHVASGPKDPAVYPFGQSVHVMTGVDKVHEQGILGKGIKIGIVDTGVDYTHPSLGGGFGPGFKVAGGYDLVGDKFFPGNSPPVPDDDPLDCNGHGTHVAGIVGANPGNEFNITGVAYEASIYSYKVFGCSESTATDVIIDGMLRAYEDGMDIISLSLGGNTGWSDDPTSLVASRIANLGVVMSIAAGNSGETGPFFPDSPGTGKDVIAVASVENVITTYQTITTSVEHAPMASTPSQIRGPHITVWQPYEVYDPFADVVGMPLDVPETPFPIYALTTDPLAPDTACKPLADDVPDLKGYAVVLRTTALPANVCSVRTQFNNLAKKNGRLIIAYNAPVIVQAPSGFQAIKLRNADDGIFLINEFSKGTNVTVSFPQHNSEVDIPNPETGGLVSYFSSFGPTNDMLFKPAVGAPGGNISSTWLTKDGSWAVASGTSMATPYLAGSAALLLQTRGKGVAKNARAIFESTAIALPESRARGSRLHTLSQQGAGLINVFNALNVQSEVSPGELLLNDTAHWRGRHKIVIKNNGKQRQTYNLSHQPAGTALVMPNHNYISYPVPSIDAPVTVHLSKARVTLAPGASTTVSVAITPPKGVDPKTLPLVSGWVRVRGSLGDRLQVSYMGIAGSLYDAQVISQNNAGIATDPSVPALILPEVDANEKQVPQVGPRNYTRSIFSLPGLAFLMAQTSARIVVDLIDANTKVEATIPIQSPDRKRATISGWWRPSALSPGGSFDDVPIIQRIVQYEHGSRLPPSLSDYYWVNFPTRYTNGTVMDFGQYRILLRALKPFGNPALQKDYETYVSEQIGVVEKL